MKKIILPILFTFSMTLFAQNNTDCTILIDAHAHVGEGAIWDYKSNRLLWIDIEQRQLHVFCPEDSSKNRTIDTKLKIGTVVPIDNENAVAALQDGIYKITYESGSIEKISALQIDTTLNRFNDGKCAPDGRLWVGTMHNSAQKPTGALYSFDAAINGTKHLDGITVSNGIVWSLDGTKMYYIDSPTQKVVQYDYNNEDGTISNPVDVIHIPGEMGSPDGSTIDADGNIWIAMWNGGSVTCWNPVTGKLLKKIEVPAWNVTSLAFGGKNLDELYITSAKLWMPEGYDEKYPHAGAVFVCKPGVKGIKANYFPFAK